MKFSHFVSCKDMYTVEIHGYKRLHMASGYEEPNINVSAFNTLEYTYLKYIPSRLTLTKP